MVCIYCGAKTHISNSRHQRRPNQVWRRRCCWNCDAIFTTEEAAQYSSAWSVRDNKGSLQPFSRDKLFISLYKSCEHRPARLSDSGSLTATVIIKLASQVSNGILSSQAIASTVQVTLSRFDKIASVHYTALHRA